MHQTRACCTFPLNFPAAQRRGPWHAAMHTPAGQLLSSLLVVKGCRIGPQHKSDAGAALGSDEEVLQIKHRIDEWHSKHAMRAVDMSSSKHAW